MQILIQRNTRYLVVAFDMNSILGVNRDMDDDVHGLSHNIPTRFVPRCSHGSGLEAPSSEYFNARSRLPAQADKRPPFSAARIRVYIRMCLYISDEHNKMRESR